MQDQARPSRAGFENWQPARAGHSVTGPAVRTGQLHLLERYVSQLHLLGQPGKLGAHVPNLGRNRRVKRVGPRLANLGSAEQAAAGRPAQRPVEEGEGRGGRAPQVPLCGG